VEVKREREEGKETGEEGERGWESGRDR